MLVLCTSTHILLLGVRRRKKSTSTVSICKVQQRQNSSNISRNVQKRDKYLVPVVAYPTRGYVMERASVYDAYGRRIIPPGGKHVAASGCCCC